MHISRTVWFVVIDKVIIYNIYLHIYMCVCVTWYIFIFTSSQLRYIRYDHRFFTRGSQSCINLQAYTKISLAVHRQTLSGAQGPVSLTLYARNSNSMETSPCHNSVAGQQIATSFCTCHDSTAVVPCTKFCSDHCIRIETRVKRSFHRIWVAMGESLVKRCPGQIYLPVIN